MRHKRCLNWGWILLTSRRTMLAGMLCSCAARFIWSASAYAQGQDITGGGGLNQSKDVPVDRFKEANAAALASLGCSWSAAGHGAAGDDHSPKLLNSSGNQELDAGITRERNFYAGLMGSKPAVFFFDEGSDQNANAFATPDHLGGSNAPDGTVVFGLHLIAREQQRLGQLSFSSRWDHVCAAILAHEMGHITQFQRANQTRMFPRGKYMELHADFLAGWYMQRRASQTSVDLASPMKEFFSIGDYHFNSPSHHGTPQERWNFLAAGMNSSLQGTPFENAFQQGLALVTRS